MGTVKEAELMLGEFEDRWDAEYLPIGQSWRRNWGRLTPFFDYACRHSCPFGCVPGRPQATLPMRRALLVRVCRLACAHRVMRPPRVCSSPGLGEMWGQAAREGAAVWVGRPSVGVTQAWYG